MCGTTSRHMRTAPKRFVSNVSRQTRVAESSSFASNDSGKTPALLTSTDGAPCERSMCSTKRRTLFVSVVTGGYAVCDFDDSPRCEPRCHCHASFVAVGARTRCSIAEVAEIGADELEAQTDALAWHFVKDWAAPSWEAARALAEEEIR